MPPVFSFSCIASLTCVKVAKGERHTPAHRAINSNGKTPAWVDGDVTVFGSNAILLYLADKTGTFLPANTPGARGEMCAWMMLLGTGAAPITGRFAHLELFAPEPLADALNRFEFEAWLKALFPHNAHLAV